MKKVLALVLAVMLLVCGLAGCGAKGKVVVGYTIYEPMNYLDENGELVGFDTELAEAVVRGLHDGGVLSVAKHYPSTSAAVDTHMGPAVSEESYERIVDYNLYPYLELSKRGLMDGIMVGATQSRIMRDSMIYSTIAYFAIFYTMRPLIGNNALWLAFSSYMFLRGVLQYFMAKRLQIVYKQAEGAAKAN